MLHRDLHAQDHTPTPNLLTEQRSSNEIFDDMLSLEQPGDDPKATFAVIAACLRWHPDRAQRRFYTICEELGVPHDED